MPRISDEFRDELLTRGILLSRFEPTVRRQILGRLQQLEEELERKILRFDIEGVLATSFKRRRAERLLQEVQATIRTAYREKRQLLVTNLRELAQIEGEAVIGTLNDVVDAEIFKSTITPGALRATANNALILGGPAKDWWSQQELSTRVRFASQIRMGYLANETNQQLVRRMRDVLSTSRHQVTTLVRTSVQTVSNAVMADIYEQNKAILRGVQALVTLDSRTTRDICAPRSGASWDLETGKPLPGSPRIEHYPGPPPWHHNCRTVLIPITKSWTQLMKEGGHGRKRALNTVPDSKRASMDGQVAGNLNFEGWLKTKSPSFARRHLGPGRYELWKDGKISIAQLADQSGRPVPLERLRRVRRPSAKPLP